MLIRVMLFAVVASVVGCAAPPLQPSQGELLLREGKFEQGLELLRQEADNSEPNSRLRAEYHRYRESIIAQLLSQAENARIAADLPRSERLYRRVLKLDLQNRRATLGIELLKRQARHAPRLAEAEKQLRLKKLDKAEEQLQPILAEDPGHAVARDIARRIAEERIRSENTSPELGAEAAKTVSLEFRDVSLRSVFEILTRAAGINFVLDHDIRTDAKTTIFVKDTSIAKVIDMLLLTNQLEKKVMDERTVLIYPKTAQKLREYRDLVVKSFYLANADPKLTFNLIRTILKTRDVFIDEKLGLLVMRDTPEAIRLAEKLIASQDLAAPEVMLQVEVLEVSANKLDQIGIRWPDQITLTPSGISGGSATAGTLTLRELRDLNSQAIRTTVTSPSLVFDLKQTDGQTNILANPRIRVKNHEKAKIHIGDRVPVITTTAAAVGGFISESVTYLDVGLKLEVEPTISLDNEVSIKVGLEVSNIVREVRGGSSSSNTLTYQVGTRNASTVLRLRDGETQILAGLISDEDRRTASRVPGIGDLPVLGRLFSSQGTNATKSEIVLLITPHVVRALARPEAHMIEFRSGTEASVGAGAAGAAPGFPIPVRPGTTPAPRPKPRPAVNPFAPAAGAPAPGTVPNPFQRR